MVTCTPVYTLEINYKQVSNFGLYILYAIILFSSWYIIMNIMVHLQLMLEDDKVIKQTFYRFQSLFGYTPFLLQKSLLGKIIHDH